MKPEGTLNRNQKKMALTEDMDRPEASTRMVLKPNIAYEDTELQ